MAQKISENGRRIKLNESAVKQAAAPDKGFALYWDTELRGFGLRVTAAGTRAFILQDRIKGRERRITLGQWPGVSAALARDIAKKRIGQIADGVDIIAERERDALAKLTLSDAVDEYIKRKDLKASTIADIRRAVRETFDDWQKKPVTRITRKMVQDRYQERAERSKARAVVAFRYLRAILNLVAVQHRDNEGLSVLPDNPVRVLSEGRMWHRIEPRRRVLSPDDLTLWVPAVMALGDDDVRDDGGKFTGGARNGEAHRDLLLFMALTGCRRGEALGLEKRDVELHRGRYGVLVFRDTKNRTDHQLPLTAELKSLLERRMKASTSDYVFGTRWTSAPLSNFRTCFQRIEDSTKLRFSLHDLRRLAATTMERCAVPVHVIKSVLNHKSQDITGRYVQVDPAMQLEALEKLGAFVLKHQGAA